MDETLRIPEDGWKLTGSDGVYYLRPLVGKQARRIIPDVVEHISAILNTEAGAALLDKAQEVIKRPRQYDEEGNALPMATDEMVALVRSLLPAIQGGASLLRSFQEFMEDRALVVMTTIPQSVIDDCGQPEEIFPIIIEVLMHHWSRITGQATTTTGELEGALKKSESAALEHDTAVADALPAPEDMATAA